MGHLTAVGNGDVDLEALLARTRDLRDGLHFD